MCQSQTLIPWSQWANMDSVSVGTYTSSMTARSEVRSRERIQLSLNLCVAIEAGPQPNGVVRADIYNMVKEAWELTLEWIQLFNSGRKKT